MVFDPVCLVEDDDEEVEEDKEDEEEDAKGEPDSSAEAEVEKVNEIGRRCKRPDIGARKGSRRPPPTTAADAGEEEGDK